VNHSLLIYGDFGSGKTSLWELLAQRLLQPSQKVRLVTAEHANSIKPSIDSGFVEHCKVSIRQHPFDALRKMVRDGLWPVDTEDPNSKWIAPTAETWERYPFRVFEGMATFSTYLADGQVLGGLKQRTAVGSDIGINEGGKIRFDDGDEQIGGTSQTSFRIVQDEMESLVQRSQDRPGWTIWTSHPDIIYKKVKTPTGQVVNGTALFGGPEVYGGALTGSIGKHFADVWRITSIDDERYLYIKPHTDEEIKWKCKNSAPIEKQDRVPDRFKLTEKGLPKRNAAGEIDIASRIVKALWGGE
jgi:hypothetical protein